MVPPQFDGGLINLGLFMSILLADLRKVAHEKSSPWNHHVSMIVKCIYNSYKKPLGHEKIPWKIIVDLDDTSISLWNFMGLPSNWSPFIPLNHEIPVENRWFHTITERCLVFSHRRQSRAGRDTQGRRGVGTSEAHPWRWRSKSRNFMGIHSGDIPSGKLRVCELKHGHRNSWYRPIKNGDFPSLCKRLQEG